jgi:hypothetical protein
MPSWIMSSERDGAEISFYIGSLKVAAVRMMPQGKKWRAYLRLFEHEGHDCASVSEAMKLMHKLLKEPRLRQEDLR